MEYSEHQLIEQFNDDFKTVVFPVTIFVGIEIIIGFCGNILVLYVFYFRYRRCNFRNFVICLALTDLISTMTTMPIEVFTQSKWYTFSYRQVCKIKSYFNMVLLASQMLCLLTIAVDRYRKVCQPFGRQITPAITSILCIGIYIFSAFLSVPAYVLTGTRRLHKTYQNVSITVTICEKDEQYAQTRYPLQYALSVYVLCALTLASTLVLYIIIIRKLAEHRHAFSRHVMNLISRTSISTGQTFKFNERSSADELTSETRRAVNDAGPSSGRETARFKMNTLLMDEKISPNEKKTQITVMPSLPPDEDRSDPNREQICTNDITGQINKTFTAKYNDDSLDRSMVSDGDETPVRNSSYISLQIPETFRTQTNVNQNKKNTPKRHLKISKRQNTKTKIMLFLTVMFIITIVCYVSLIGKIANDDVLQEISDTDRTVYFFFLRLYFINHVVNPIVYSLLDPQYRKLLKQAIGQKSCC